MCHFQLEFFPIFELILDGGILQLRLRHIVIDACLERVVPEFKNF